MKTYRAVYFNKERNLYWIRSSSFSSFASILILASEGTWELLGVK